MTPKYRIHEIRKDDGERLPILVESDGTIPFLPAYYVMSMCRTHDSSSTIRIKLESIKFFYIWAKKNDIDIEERFKSEKMLSLGEVDNLVYYSRLTLDHLTSEIENNPSKILHFSISLTTVDHTTHVKRLNTISHYIDWMTRELMKNWNRKDPKYQAQLLILNEILSSIKNRTARRISKSASKINPPKGFSREVHDRILEVIEFDHPENPWRNQFVKVRNQLYVTICIALGPRIGESLNIKLQDVDLSGEQPKIRIVRRPDDIEEDRNRAPKVKTLERTLLIGRTWAMLFHTYINKYRRRIRGARKHNFLFVARDGTKLSYSSACLIFTTLRTNVEGLPPNLSQHLCRHAWNERFSEKGEQKGLKADKIQEQRRELMGWSPSSNMPELYDRRFTKNKADALSLEMQDNFFKNRK